MRAVEKKKLRAQLEQKRQEALASYKRSRATNRESGEEGLQDLADRATESYWKEFLYSLSDGERELLKMVDAALVRMDDGTYEKCQACGTKINLQRLKAIPWASLCIECQEKQEAGEQI
ncbi:MAG: TraR/DksA family transcriptional regulator [Acidobacteriota bacterium]